ncbi:hypothetical protein C6988_08905 [Nitrosopumilus sp. b1]|uniref:hypothetical protein n=1 Tax=Nitrosopumilus sp. b1 TaxID=2109907 RepID=UPI0015F633FA|nr:hypothetical protein [Nitrosopumilus sp. b1]KAF6242333.1 hypothetical protein C6988_08905 [Nitrosopumilus sp. b1]
MESDEKKIRQEDCSEDGFGPGILTITNKRIAFDKTRGRIMDFSKKFGDTVIDVPLVKIKKVWKEGLLMKKVCFSVETEDGEKSYKFGVFSNGSWLETFQDAIEEAKNQ